MIAAAGTAGAATRTHCPYCALQCGVRLEIASDGALRLAGDEAFPVNRGQLCIKGWTAAAAIDHPERLREPLVRDAGGVLRSARWEVAWHRIVDGIGRVQAEAGRDGVAVFGSGALTNEKVYLLGKLARVALGTSQIDYNGRFCMSSAAAASLRALGIDRGLPFPVEDLAEADVILLGGANPAETMPPLMRYVDAMRARGGELIVVDPRRSATAEQATLHLQPRPGTDLALTLGMLHVLVRDGMVDERYIESRTEGFDRVKAAVTRYWPERVERLTGIPEARVAKAAHLVGQGRRVIVLTGRGPEQQAQGVANALGYINLALAIGAVGRRGSGYGCLTGQGNGQGGREHGQKADQLPGYRRLDRREDREHVARVWGVPPESLPVAAVAGRSAYELLDALGRPEGPRALLVFGSNPVVSAPRAVHVEERLRALDLLVVADCWLSETAAIADVVLPIAQWTEEEGTLTNLEGRVLRRRAAQLPPAGVPTELELLCELAARLGHGDRFRYAGAEAVFDELRRASAGGAADYSGITYDRIDAEQGVHWPCRDTDRDSDGDGDAPGTPRLFLERFPTPSGRARFHAVEPVAPNESPDEDYPLHLTTGRILAHYQSGAQTRRIPALDRLAPHPIAQLHPTVARRHRLGDGDEITLATRRGRMRARVAIDPGIRPDTVFVPFHYGGEHSINRVTDPALDPTSRMPSFKLCAVRICDVLEPLAPDALDGGEEEEQ